MDGWVSKHHHFSLLLFACWYILPTWQLSISLKLENFLPLWDLLLFWRSPSSCFMRITNPEAHPTTVYLYKVCLHFSSCHCHSRSIPEGVLVDYGDTSSPATSTSASSPDTDLRLAMELSAQAQAEEERLRKQEEEELERILQLSLTEK